MDSFEDKLKKREEMLKNIKGLENYTYDENAKDPIGAYFRDKLTCMPIQVSQSIDQAIREAGESNR
jgi:hypothetical protein